MARMRKETALTAGPAGYAGPAAQLRLQVRDEGI